MYSNRDVVDCLNTYRNSSIASAPNPKSRSVEMSASCSCLGLFEEQALVQCRFLYPSHCMMLVREKALCDLWFNKTRINDPAYISQQKASPPPSRQGCNGFHYFNSMLYSRGAVQCWSPFTSINPNLDPAMAHLLHSSKHWHPTSSIPTQDSLYINHYHTSKA